MRVRDFETGDLDGVLTLTNAEGWPSYGADPARALRALTAPGIATIVADDSGEVVGFATGGGDGEIQGYLINIAVGAAHRRKGIARKLIAALFARLNVGRIDLLSLDGAEEFYRSYEHHRRMPGYRIHR